MLLDIETGAANHIPSQLWGCVYAIQSNDHVCLPNICHYLDFGNPLKTSNLEGLEGLDRFRGIRTLEGLEVLRDIRLGCSTCFQPKQFYTLIVMFQQKK